MNAENTLFVSADFGNHYAKIYTTRPNIGTNFHCIDSGLMFDQPDKGIKYTPDEDDVFYCKHGSKNWRDKCWFMHPKGDRPFNLNGSDFCNGSDSAKGYMALPLLVSTIWDELKDGDVIQLNASTQNIHTTRELMTSELEGTHTIVLNKVAKRFTIKKPDVLAEGVGSLLVHKIKKSDVALLMDIGGDTVIVSIFAGVKLSGDVIPMQGLGTNHIIKLALGNEDICKALGRQPYNDDEVVAILRGETFQDRNDVVIDFKPALKKLTDKWLSDINKLVIAPYRLRVNEANLRLATGGATLIYGMKEGLKARGFETIKDGQRANVKGLHDRLLGQHGVQVVEKAKSTKKRGVNNA